MSKFDLNYFLSAQTQLDADIIFDEYVTWLTESRGDQAITVAKDNIGYLGGYCSSDDRRKLERLYNCVHPFLGSVDANLTPEEIFTVGMKIAEEFKQGKLVSLHPQPQEKKKRRIILE